MKKLVLAAGLFASQFVTAQTLTKANNEPAVGDIHTMFNCDTVSVLPRNTGLNQTWNFSSLHMDTASAFSSTFIAASSAPNYSLFSGATIAEDAGDGYYVFYKSVSSPTTQFERMGNTDVSTPSLTANYSYTNTGVEFVWPITYGSTFSDAFSGTASGAYSGGGQGGNTVTATGTGTVILPGGASVANVLQVKSQIREVTSYTQPFAFSYTANITLYDYYAPGQKFPIVSVTVEMDDDGTFNDTSIYVTMNKVILHTAVGISSKKLDSQYSIYPNPAKDSFEIKLANTANETCAIAIYDVTGRLVKQTALGNASLIDQKILLNGILPGVYLVKTTAGDRSSSKRLIIE